MTNLEVLRLLQRIQRNLLLIEHTLDLKDFKESNPVMAIDPKVAALIAEFDAATDKIAARIQKLIETDTSLSAESQAALQAEVDKLNLLGQDPAQPVPPAAA